MTVVALAITAPIIRLNAASLFVPHHVTKRPAPKRTSEKIAMLGLAQNGSGFGGSGAVGVGAVGLEEVLTCSLALSLCRLETSALNRSIFWVGLSTLNRARSHAAAPRSQA